MPDASDIGQDSTPAQSGFGNILLLRGLAMIALCISGYLLSVSLIQQGLPVGCGAGSGCATVLASRWASVLGLPVGGLATLTYLAVLAASFLVSPHQCERKQKIGWTILITLATGITSTAAWFVILQFFVLQAVCYWCMADHVLGLSLSMLVFRRVMIQRQVGGSTSNLDVDEQCLSDRDSPPIMTRRISLVAPVLTGLTLVLIMVGLQCAFEGSSGGTIRLPPGRNADTGPGPHRQIAIINGKLQLAPHDLPVLGSPDSPKLLIVLFDYCCPHCRATHEYLVQLLPSLDQQLGIVLLPMPMDQRCNRTVKHTEPRFQHACELARLALGVWRAKPAVFPEFDRWLFETELPRDPAVAHRKAEELLETIDLETTLKDPWIDQQIAANVQAYIDSQADRIPIIMSPGFSSIVGRPESQEELLQTLHHELHLPLTKPGS